MQARSGWMQSDVEHDREKSRQNNPVVDAVCAILDKTVYLPRPKKRRKARRVCESITICEKGEGELMGVECQM